MTRLMEVQDLLDRFEQLDRLLPTEVTQPEPSAQFHEARKAKIYIKVWLAKNTGPIPPELLARRLRGIRSNKGCPRAYTVDAAQEVFSGYDHWPDWIDDDDVHLVRQMPGLEELWPDGIDVVGILMRYLACGSLVTTRKIPEHVSEAFLRLQLCFAFGLWEPSIVFCRSVIDAAAHAWLMGAGLTKRKDARWADSKGSEDTDKSLLQRHRPDLGLSPAAGSRTLVDAVRRRANEIVHPKFVRQEPSAKQERALSDIRETQEFVEALYDRAAKTSLSIA